MPTSPIERHLAAIVAADVVGYSRLMGANEHRTLAALKAHRTELIDPLVAAYKGHIVKTTGDGLLLSFPSVVEAVSCAVAMQHGMARRNQDVTSDRRIEFRIGVHIGDVIVEKGDVFGDGVNIAARLEQIAPAGGICLSEDAFRQVRGKLDIPITDAGEQTLKNISNPVRAYRIERSVVATVDVPPPPAESQSRSRKPCSTATPSASTRSDRSGLAAAWRPSGTSHRPARPRPHRASLVIRSCRAPGPRPRGRTRAPTPGTASPPAAPRARRSRRRGPGSRPRPADVEADVAIRAEQAHLERCSSPSGSEPVEAMVASAPPSNRTMTAFTRSIADVTLVDDRGHLDGPSAEQPDEERGQVGRLRLALAATCDAWIRVRARLRDDERRFLAGTVPDPVDRKMSRAVAAYTQATISTSPIRPSAMAAKRSHVGVVLPRIAHDQLDPTLAGQECRAHARRPGRSSSASRGAPAGRARGGSG